MKQSRWINKLSICERCCQRRELLVDLTNLIQFYLLGILSFCFVNSCQFVILIVSSLFVIRIWIFLYGICAMCFIFITLQYLPNQWIALLARFDWLPQLGRFLAIHCSPTGAKMASRFEAFSEDEIWPINEAVFTNKYQESDYLWLVGVYW